MLPRGKIRNESLLKWLEIDLKLSKVKLIFNSSKTTSNKLVFTFFECAKVAFSIFIESCKLIDNIYETKFVCSLFVGIQYCQLDC